MAGKMLLHLRKPLTITAEIITVPATVFAVLIPKTDKPFPALTTGQNIWLSVAAAVPPGITALVTAENLFPASRSLAERLSAVFTYCCIRLI